MPAACGLNRACRPRRKSPRAPAADPSARFMPSIVPRRAERCLTLPVPGSPVLAPAGSGGADRVLPESERGGHGAGPDRSWKEPGGMTHTDQPTAADAADPDDPYNAADRADTGGTRARTADHGEATDTKARTLDRAHATDTSARTAVRPDHPDPRGSAPRTGRIPGRERLALAVLLTAGFTLGAGAGHRRRHAGRVVAADHLVPRGAGAGPGAGAQRGADGGRVHHRCDRRRRADRSAELAVGVLRQRRGGGGGPRRRAAGPGGEPAGAPPRAGRARRAHGDARPAGAGVRADPGR